MVPAWLVERLGFTSRVLPLLSVISTCAVLLPVTVTVVGVTAAALNTGSALLSV